MFQDFIGFNGSSNLIEVTNLASLRRDMNEPAVSGFGHFSVTCAVHWELPMAVGGVSFVWLSGLMPSVLMEVPTSDRLRPWLP
jgi:hypothetical protein